MLQTIVSAIKTRQFITFTYSGLSRLVQPAAVGISTTGKTLLRCYQIRGGHIAPGHEWDLCDLAKISGLRATGEYFEGEPPGYKRGDKTMTTIYAEL